LLTLEKGMLLIALQRIRRALETRELTLRRLMNAQGVFDLKHNYE